MEYDGRLAGEERVRIVLDWLDLPPDRRPTLVTLYWSDVDSAAHDTGTASPETAAAIERVDGWIGLLLEGLEHRGLDDRVNLLVVSDHGMADTPAEKTLVLEDFVDLEGVEISGGTPVLFLRPPAARLEAILRALDGAHPALEVMRREETPRRWHFRDHPRIPPLLVAVDEGWNLRVERADADEGAPRRPPLGMHGYDPKLRSMHGFLVARGPGFAADARVGRIANLHLYELMCHLLGIEPAANEGRLRAVRRLLARESRRRAARGG
jgi:predicted AlkP superfamily pyrophosphatase or phosphodiesterase